MKNYKRMTKAELIVQLETVNERNNQLNQLVEELDAERDKILKRDAILVMSFAALAGIMAIVAIIF